MRVRPEPVPRELAVADERFVHALAGLFAARIPDRPARQRVDAAAVADALARRARRRRARFDVLLHEALPEHAHDLALAVRAQQGDASAVTEIVRRLEPVVVARVHAFGLEWNRDELVHDVLGRAWEKLGLYRGEASLRTWCGRLTHNYLVNWARDNKTRLQCERPLADEADPTSVAVPSADAVDGDLLAHERARRVEHFARDLAALARSALTAAEWELIQQVVIDGTPYQEIGARLGVKPGTLRVRLFRAVGTLRAAALAARGDDYEDLVVEALAHE